ncbi:MAG: futalosine hydrolase [Planctomycetota bacterium]|jgi:futalosine hydrolase
MPVDFLVCVATEAEGDHLRRRLGGDTGSIAGRSVALAVTGVGPVNAAYAAATADARALLVCGVGGAYPGSGLDVGSVACAETEIYADLGVEGAWDMQAIGFPVVGEHFNRLPLTLFPAAHRAAFVTSSTCTATDARAAELVARTGGAVESMEGAAVVHVAIRRGLDVGELRGISNLVGDRDRSGWKVKEAARAAQETLLDWIEEQA